MIGRRATTVVLGPADAAPIGELRTGSTLPDGFGTLLELWQRHQLLIGRSPCARRDERKLEEVADAVGGVCPIGGAGQGAGRTPEASASPRLGQCQHP